MNINLHNKQILIDNSIEVVLLKTKASEIRSVINVNQRTVNLNHGVELIIFNDLGIRLWSKNDIVYQMGIAYQISPTMHNMPDKEFDGFLKVGNTSVDKYTNAQQIIDELNLKIDEDSLRFKVVLYYGIVEDLSISFIVDEGLKVKNFFITKPNIQQFIV